MAGNRTAATPDDSMIIGNLYTLFGMKCYDDALYSVTVAEYRELEDRVEYRVCGYRPDEDRQTVLFTTEKPVQLYAVTNQRIYYQEYDCTLYNFTFNNYLQTWKCMSADYSGNDRREETVMTIAPGIRSGTVAWGGDLCTGEYIRLDLSTGEKTVISLPEGSNGIRLSGGMLYIMTGDSDELVTMEKIKEFESQNDMHARDYKEKVYAYMTRLRSGLRPGCGAAARTAPAWSCSPNIRTPSWACPISRAPPCI